MSPLLSTVAATKPVWWCDILNEGAEVFRRHLLEGESCKVVRGMTTCTVMVA